MFDISRVTHIGDCNKTDKPWGYEVLWAQTESYVAKLMHIQSGCRMSLQFHNTKEETIYVMRGELIVWENEDDDDYTGYPAGYVYHVKPGMVHRFGAPEKDDVMLIEVSTNHLDDVVRIKDDYKR